MAISPYSKALGFQPRSMEIMQMAGLIDQFLARGQPMSDFNYYIGTRHMAQVPVLRGNTKNTHYGYGLFLEQAITSEILIEELKALGVKVDHGWEVLDTKVVEEDEDETQQQSAGSEKQHKKRKTYVETTIRRALEGSNVSEDEKKLIGNVDPLEEDTGKEYEIQIVRSKYLVAADGGRSTIRHKLNIGFPGQTLNFKTMMWDGTCECALEFKDIMFVQGTNKKTMIAFPLTNGSMRVGFESGEVQPGENMAETARNLTVEMFEEQASAILGTPFKVKTTEWLTIFRVNERRAENFIYKNRIFLAGDAAHVHSPAGGQGMNTGLQDAHNLAWKLALVIHGLAPEALLDTYHEREPLADRAINLSHYLLMRNRDTSFFGMLKKYLFIIFAPFMVGLMKIFSFAPEVSMLKVRYQENSLNQPHATQPAPATDCEVGVRAQDGTLTPVSSTKEDKDVTTLRLHELTAGIGRFHILVFTSDMLALNHSSSVYGVPTTQAVELENNINKMAQQWRTKWAYGTDLHDGYDGKGLFKIHVIAGSVDSMTEGTSTEDKRSLDRLVNCAKGEGKVFLDETKTVHPKYGFSWNKGHGGIVVIRPDSHVGYRVNGAGEQAWKDVDQYLSSILAA